eukprot:COSAG01_NODE_57682_length_310_cov_3.039120_1_plen_65_part_10
MRGHTLDTIGTVGYDYKKLLYTGTCAPPTKKTIMCVPRHPTIENYYVCATSPHHRKLLYAGTCAS